MSDSFGTGVEDWKVVSNSSLTATSTGGRLKVSITGSGGSAREYTTTFAGKSYVYTFHVDTGNITYTIQAAVKDSVTGAILDSVTVRKNGNYKLKFNAKGGSTFLYFTQTGTYAASKFFFLDNVLVEEDMSVKPGYAFGFNGKFKDNETYGDGNEYDYGDRIYNSRLGKWFSVDPLVNKYAYFSPYTFVANNPLIFIDKDGKDIYIVDPANRDAKPILYVPGMSSEGQSEFASNAINSLNKLYYDNNGGSREIVKTLTRSDYKVSITQTSEANGGDTYGGTIRWNDKQGDITNTSNPITGSDRRPPQATLYHELLHKYLKVNTTEAASLASGLYKNGLITKEQFEELGKQSDKMWGTILTEEKVEQYIIENYENAYNLEAGWGLRKDEPLNNKTAHESSKGTYNAETPTSTEGECVKGCKE